MFLIAALFSFHLSWLHAPSKAPAPTCGISIVSYRFEGKPGTEFVYSGTKYVVPASGWVELLAKRAPSNRTIAYGRELLLDVWPADQFGTRHVPLPKPPNSNVASATGGIR